MTSRSGQSDAPQAVPKRLLAIGTTIDSGVIVFFWVAGAVILGLFVLLTRGKVTIIEEQTVRLREGLGSDADSSRDLSLHYRQKDRRLAATSA